MSKTLDITIDEGFLQSCATASLSGALVKANGWQALQRETPIRLIFPQRCLTRCQKDGPREWIVMEYSVPCLLQDILTLVGEGFSINVDVCDVDD